MPAFEALRSDHQGNIWVQEYRRPGAATIRWQILSASGTLVATLEVPSQFAITDVGRNRVAGIWIDENDVETVRVYLLRK